MSYWLHPEAEAELGNAAAYYAEKANPSIAEAYVNEFERVLAIIVRNQQFGTPTDDGLRKYRFGGFPNTFIYRENEAEGPRVYAVAHQSRRPAYWRDRLHQ